MLSTQDIDPSKSGKRPSAVSRALGGVWNLLVPPTQAHQDRQSPFARAAGPTVLILLCAAAIASIFLFGRPIKNSYDDWKATGLVEDAREALKAGDPTRAYIHAQEAYKRQPEHVDAIRLNAELFTRASRAEAVWFWGLLDKKGASTLDDQCGNVLALNRLGRTKEAAAALDELLLTNPSDARLIRVAVEILGQKEAQTRLIGALKTYTDKHQEDRESRLSMAKLQTHSGVSQDRRDGRVGLWALCTDEANSKDKHALDALRQLATLGDLDLAESERFKKLVEAHPDATEKDHVDVMDVRYRAAPQRKDDLIAHCLTKITGTGKAKKLEAFARWLSVHDEHGRVLALLSEKDVRTNQLLLSSYLNALTFLGRNTELSRMVNDPQVLLSPATRAFYRAHLAFVTRKSAEELRPLFLSALVGAEGEGLSQMLLTIGEYGEKKGFLDIAEQAYKSAARDTKVDRKSFVGLIRTATHMGHTDEVYAAAREAARRWPDAQEFQERAIYTSLLLGQDLETCLARADRLLQTNDKDPMCKLINALGSWRLGDEQSMAAYCQNLDIADLRDGERSVLSGMVRAAGYKAEAGLLLGYINPATPMLPEERLFLGIAQQQ
jgi:hypothetical protein